jgi:guanylate kinase
MHTRRKIRKELSLTVAEYVQNNLMDQLTERVKMRGTNNKKKRRKRIENVCFSATATLERIYIRHVLWIIYYVQHGM